MKKENAKGKWSMSQRLQFAAFMVAAPRYMAMGAMAIGVQLTSIHWFFIAVEVVSWLGFAVLEGYAIPYIAKGIRRVDRRSFEWWQLQVYRLLLLLAIPVLGAPLYLAISQKQTIIQAAGVAGFVVWSFILTGIGALIIDAVGTVESVNEPEQGEQVQLITTRRSREGVFSTDELAKLLATKRPDLTPDDFVIALEAGSGVVITTSEAEVYLSTARAQQAGNGRGRRVPLNGTH